MSKYRLNIQPPVTDNGKLKVSANSVIFKNEGDVTAYIDMNWTLKPGAVFQFGLNDDDDVIEQEFAITFKQKNVSTDKLRIEISEFNKINC